MKLVSVGPAGAEQLAVLAGDGMLLVSTGVTGPAEPILFLKPPESVVGAGDPVLKPVQTEQLDYELELAVVIGRACRKIPAATALQHVFGYAIANDVTARDVALGAGLSHPMLTQVARGKGFPTFCPLGPWVLTSDEIDDVTALRMRLWVNDELRQQDVTGSMIFGVPELIESISATMPLMPGDVILTGTPAGCGFQRDPAVYLMAGDVIRAEIEGLGEMLTVVQDESGSH